MGKRTGAAIKKARTDAGMTQEQLARKIKGVSATDISNAERGNIDLTQQQLKDIAKATGVTQTSLLNASSSSRTTTKKTSSRTTSTKTSSRTSSTKSTSRTTNARTTGAKSSMQVTATERKLINLYREADSATKKDVMNTLKGTANADIIGDIVQTALEGTIKKIKKGKNE